MMTPMEKASAVFATLLVSAVPLLHLGPVQWAWMRGRKTRRVDRNMCKCGCWDGLFKGTYETSPWSGLPDYKHVYFNLTWNTCAIYLATCACALALYEVAKRAAWLALKGRARKRYLLLLAASLHSHYYSWWAAFNYFNDDFFEQVLHQSLYTVTEVMSSAVVFRFADAENEIDAGGILTIIGVAMCHVLGATWDQFLANVLRGGAPPTRQARDLALMAADLAHLALPLADLVRIKRAPTWRQLAGTAAWMAAGLTAVAAVGNYEKFSKDTHWIANFYHMDKL